MNQADLLLEQLDRIGRTDIPRERRTAIVRVFRATLAEELAQRWSASYEALLRDLARAAFDDALHVGQLRDRLVVASGVTL